MSSPAAREREARVGLGPEGRATYRWRLTNARHGDPVRLVLPPNQVLPVIFVPGIMGSILMDLEGTPVWRLGTTFGVPLGLSRRMAFNGLASRQRLMHP